MPGPRLVFVLALITMLVSVVPFVGLLAVVLFAVTWRRRQIASAAMLRSATLLLSAISIALALAWGVVFAEPARPCVRAQSPIVSSFDGQTLTPEGSFVSGALYPWAERRDVLRAAHVRAPGSDPTHDEQVLRVDGVAGETFQIDSASLVFAEHEPGEEIVATNEQSLVPVRDAREPRRALSFVDGHVGGEPVRSWELAFERPATERVVLVLTARTTAFAEDAFARYLGTMGQAMDPLMANVTRETCSDACRQEVWDDETERLGIPLVVTVRGGPRHLIAPVGASGMRRFAVVLDVPRGAEAEVSLHATPGFWEIASATLGLYAGEVMGEVVPPSVAMLRHADDGERAEDVRPLVLQSDRVRAAIHEHESLELHFPARAAPKGRAQSTFIALRGHYRVPTGGRRFLNVAAIAAHRWGLTSLPRFAATLH